MHRSEFALILLVLAASGCIGAPDFGKQYSGFSQMLQRNGADEQSLIPPTPEQLSGLKVELLAYQDSVQKQGTSKDQQALSLLAESELNLVSMQENIWLAQEQTRMANLAFPSCDENSNLGKALGLLDSAQAQATLAENNFQSFQDEYPGQSGQTKINFTTLSVGISGSKQSITQSKEIVQQFCP